MTDDASVRALSKIDKKKRRDEKNTLLTYKLTLKTIQKINHRDEFAWHIITLLNDSLRVVIDMFNLRLLCVIAMYAPDELSVV